MPLGIGYNKRVDLRGPQLSLGDDVPPPPSMTGVETPMQEDEMLAEEPVDSRRSFRNALMARFSGEQARRNAEMANRVDERSDMRRVLGSLVDLSSAAGTLGGKSAPTQGMETAEQFADSDMRRVQGLQQASAADDASQMQALRGLQDLEQEEFKNSLQQQELEAKKQERNDRLNLEKQKLDQDRRLEDRRINVLQAKQTAKTPDDFKAEDTLRKEVISHPVVKRSQEVRESYNKISQASPDAAGDLSLIFAYMKMLDPASTVREGEFANAQNAGGVDDSIKNLYNKARSGERLNPRQREMFKSQAKRLFEVHSAEEQKVLDRYKGITGRRGLNFKNIYEEPAIEPSANTDDVIGQALKKRGFQ